MPRDIFHTTRLTGPRGPKIHRKSPFCRPDFMDIDPSAPPARTDPYIAWKNGSFVLYATSWFLVTFAKQIEFVAMNIFVFHLAGKNPLSLGLLGLVQAGPVMLLAIPGGHIADRWPRRIVVAITLGLSALVALALVVAVLLHASLVCIYGLLLLARPAWRWADHRGAALLPQLVPSQDFSNAVAWNSTVFRSRG